MRDSPTKAAWVLIATTAAIAASTSGARAKSHRDPTSVLMRIEPETRLEQVCDVEAMHRIARVKPFKPDRAKSDVLSHPVHNGDAMTAPGGAFRSRGQWYAFSFECRGTPDHLRVLSFSYKLGEAIPRAQWADLGLWQ